MRWAKDYLIENNGVNRLAYEKRMVCFDCFDDPAIEEFISQDGSEDECAYCHSQADCVSVADLARHMIDCLSSQKFGYAVDVLPYEDGYQGPHWSTAELLFEELGVDVAPKHDSLRRDICEAIGDEPWCELDPFSLSEHERLTLSWDGFCHTVKHELRFMFLREGVGHDKKLLEPAEILQELGRFCGKIGLIKTLSRGTTLFRVRCEETPKGWQTVEDLGPPPVEKTQANRMSPSGIVMFYASENPETALRETARKPNRYTIGTFKTLEDVNILDLTDLQKCQVSLTSIRTAIATRCYSCTRSPSNFQSPLR